MHRLKWGGLGGWPMHTRYLGRGNISNSKKMRECLYWELLLGRIEVWANDREVHLSFMPKMWEECKLRLSEYGQNRADYSDAFRLSLKCIIFMHILWPMQVSSAQSIGWKYKIMFSSCVNLSLKICFDDDARLCFIHDGGVEEESCFHFLGSSGISHTRRRRQQNPF